VPAYPAAFDVPYKRPLGRMSTGFRLILSLPHALLVGTPGVGFGANSTVGLLGAVVSLTSVFAWFAILFTRRYPRDLWELAYFYLRWRANALAYVALLRDEFPPFGQGEYPASFTVDYPDRSSRWKALLRFILVIPHLLALAFVGLAWCFSTFIAWCAILLTGAYPRGLFAFSVGGLRWMLRVHAYLLLMRDEYPPFSLRA